MLNVRGAYYTLIVLLLAFPHAGNINIQQAPLEDLQSSFTTSITYTEIPDESILAVTTVCSAGPSVDITTPTIKHKLKSEIKVRYHVRYIEFTLLQESVSILHPIYTDVFSGNHVLAFLQDDLSDSYKLRGPPCTIYA